MHTTHRSLGNLVDLLSESLGGKALAANDEFFAEKENLVKDSSAEFIPGKYTERGKWMDGWETRRKREVGYDWCILKLGLPGELSCFDIDTSHFLGNNPAFASIEACFTEDVVPYAKTEWSILLAQSPLKPGSSNIFPVVPPGKDKRVFSHLRLNIFPDGGVARLRAYGKVVKDWSKESKDAEVDLCAFTNGALALACSDAFFGPMQNLIFPGESQNMGEGWETRRRRGSGFDWILLKVAAPGLARQIVVKTTHFKGNFPESCSLECCYAPDALPYDLMTKTELWHPLLQRKKLGPDQDHHFSSKDLESHKAFTHLRLNIFPDGGIARLRVLGQRS